MCIWWGPYGGDEGCTNVGTCSFCWRLDPKGITRRHTLRLYGVRDPPPQPHPQRDGGSSVIGTWVVKANSVPRAATRVASRRAAVALVLPVLRPQSLSLSPLDPSLIRRLLRLAWKSVNKKSSLSELALTCSA